VGDTVSVHVDYDRRSYIAPNHTMTHVLNYALRSVLVGNGASLLLLFGASSAGAAVCRILLPSCTTAFRWQCSSLSCYSLRC
jgi:hypothetical protein